MRTCPYFYNMMELYNREQMNGEESRNNTVRRYEIRCGAKKDFTIEEAVWIARYLDIKFDKFDIEQFRNGLDVELEHGNIDPSTNVSNDDSVITGKIALAHLNEFPDYYVRLSKMEEEAEKYWGKDE
jgi:hypothetical protein